MKFVHEKKETSKFVHQVVPINEKPKKMKFVHEKKTERGAEMLNQVEPDKERTHFVVKKNISMFVHQIEPSEESKELAEKIEELRDEIEDYSSSIYEVNSDNVLEVDPDDYPASEFALNMIQKYNITLYNDLVHSLDKEIENILKSENIHDFIKALDDYVSAIAEWAEGEEEQEEKYLKEEMIEGKPDFSDANYIVKVWRRYPAWAEGQLEAVIKCKNRKEAEKVADYVWQHWGDFGIPGGNIGTKVYKVEDAGEIAKDILEELEEDTIRLSRKGHAPEKLKIMTAKEVFEGEE
jgi:hypothetical protein